MLPLRQKRILDRSSSLWQSRPVVAGIALPPAKRLRHQRIPHNPLPPRPTTPFAHIKMERFTTPAKSGRKLLLPPIHHAKSPYRVDHVSLSSGSLRRRQPLTLTASFLGGCKGRIRFTGRMTPRTRWKMLGGDAFYRKAPDPPRALKTPTTGPTIGHVPLTAANPLFR